MDSHDTHIRAMETRPGALDPRGYLDRIGVSAPIDLDAPRPSAGLLRELHQAHMLAVPFENLSIHYGQPIVLREADLYEKIVQRRRGGFCYELNGMFAWLLRQLGYDVTLLSAGVAQSAESFTPDFDHLTLLVHQVEGDDWLADVGFGDSFRQPLRFQAALEQDGADGHVYRLRESPIDDARDGLDKHSHENNYENNHGHGQRGRPYWIMEQRGDAGWEPQYRFTLQPHALADFDERCRYQQTSPESHFTQKRICSLALPGGRVSLSDLRLITTMDGQRDERVLTSEDEYRAVLAERFGVVLWRGGRDVLST